MPLPHGPRRTALAALLVLVPTFAGCLSSTPVGGAEASGLPVTREFDLYVGGVTAAPREGLVLYGIGFSFSPDGPFTIPGPEIRVTEGDRVIVRLHDGWHTVHWHGLRVPWDMDGVPGISQDVGPGVYTYDFVVKDVGTFWYHCHIAAPVHVDEGMFGAFIVEPRNPGEDRPFDREHTLFLHEGDTTSNDLAHLASGNTESARPPTNAGRLPDYLTRGAARLHDNAAFTFDATTGWSSPVPPPGYDGYFPRYDVFMINGKTFPDTEPVTVNSGETLRLRIVNAGQYVHTIHLHGHRGLVTHKDGTALASPFWADTIGLFPGERYDVYITADNPGMWDLHDHGSSPNYGAYATNDGHYPGGMATMLVYEDFAHQELRTPVEGKTSGELRTFLRSHHARHH